MWYDRIGKVTFSQNARQKPNGQYSYTLYDPLQRIIEVGQWGGADTIDRYGAVDTVALGDWYGFLQTFGTQLTEVTHTYYDYDTLHIHDTLGVAENMYLRNRVASTTYADVLDRSNIHNYQAASHYLYDIHGNVSTLLQENTSLRRIGQQWKKINYDYDLVSGKVNEVIYQPGKPDMFIHVYEYDADNRLTDVRTTRDSVIWDHDASYSYYKHGPLARMELGDAKVQATNYAYTIQGWLKGVNGLDPEHNIGRDGESSGINSIVAKSEMGYALTYYKGDYQPISRIFATNLRPVEAEYTNLDIRSLYNGNIALMQLNLPKVGLAQAYRYSYDQLNRITGMTAYTGLTQPGNNPLGFHTATWSSSTALPDYAEKVNYDPNGNIAFYNRHGNSGTNIDMDSMLYRYLPGTNKLDHVDDAVASSNYSVDIDDQDTLNYRYDQIGNLTKDASEGIDSIKWNLYGKLQEIDKHNGDTIKFAYDPMGHRIMKEIIHIGDSLRKGTYYVLDAKGTMMATYDWRDRDTFKLNDLIMYGSGRLGSTNVGLLICDTVNNDSVTNASRSTCCGSSISGVVYHTYGIKQYELSNHLGNVLATITDRHIPVYTGPSGSLSYYKADVASAQDYYPFGMQMPGRIFNGKYRFGFNGKEDDNEIKGDGNSLDFGARIYDSRLGRFLSIDPKSKLYPWQSPYGYFANCPIKILDVKGEGNPPGTPQQPINDDGGSEGKTFENKKTLMEKYVGFDMDNIKTTVTHNNDRKNSSTLTFQYKSTGKEIGTVLVNEGKEAKGFLAQMPNGGEVSVSDLEYLSRDNTFLPPTGSPLYRTSDGPNMNQRQVDLALISISLIDKTAFISPAIDKVTDWDNKSNFGDYSFWLATNVQVKASNHFAKMGNTPISPSTVKNFKDSLTKIDLQNFGLSKHQATQYDMENNMPDPPSPFELR